MRVYGLGRGILFALLSGLGCLPWQLVWAQYTGYAGAFGIYMLLLTLASLVWIAPSLRRAALGAGLGGLMLLPLALFAPDPLAALFAGLCVLGVVRSGLLYPRPLARALGVELTLGFLASAIAILLYDASLFGAGLASWGFWLVQSAFSLLPARADQVGEARVDAFDRARAAAEQLMHGR